ncbi:crocetin glucosyltransferase 3-like [Salvia hispanica]|uniref:crocetin glucosyltransferase 3-like n=1 Tax=Salvia hispanica TaxID=49212 RepID=UPI002009A11D|nr:crocetin glucosyltransferase 3-like [Salvia hispanica]
MGGATKDVLIVPFFGQGHLFPCAELCRHISSYNCNSIFIIPSPLASSIPSDLHLNPSIEVVRIESSEEALPRDATDGDWPAPGPHHHRQLGQGIESFLSERFENSPPAFVVMDVMMNWSKHIFKKANIPIVSFFTSGACAAAMEHAAWKAHVDNIGPDPARMLPGMPESMALSYSDTRRQDRRRHELGGGRGRGGGRGSDGANSGPPRFGQHTRWMDETEGSTALLINTCDGLESPFLKYLAGQAEKPVFGVGPLLPGTFWKSIGSVVHDRDSRPGRETNYTEDEVIQWLDSKPGGSVIYVSFGSEVGPSMEEYDELAEALAETEKSFIWVIQPGAGRPGPPASLFGGRATPDSTKEGGYEPRGLEERVGNRGLIIKGWAPQLSILSHPSTGGFLSHCGWNSTMEAIACGTPILAWPIRGDQFYNAKLVVKYHHVGHMLPGIDDQLEMVKKGSIIQGINLVMDDGEVHNQATALKGIFEGGYPSSSAASVKALVELIRK